MKTILKRSILLLALSITIAFPSAAQYPSVNTGRPRINVDSARLAWLRANIAVPGEAADTFGEVTYAYEHWWINDPQLYVVGEDSAQWHWDWSSQWSGWQTVLSVLIANLTDDSLEWKRCRFIAQQAVNRIDTADFTTMEWYAKENLLRQFSDAGGLLLDWCYDRLPGDLRRGLARAMYAMNREFMNTFIYSSAGNSYVSSHNTWNTIYCNQNALVLHDADGLTAAEKDTVTQWFRDLHDKIENNFIPVWTYYRDDDGGWNWGAAYAMWSLVDQFQLFENMRIATDKNYFTDLPWVRNSINQYLYFIQPNGMCLHLGDGETFLSGDRVIYLHARYFNDPRSLWMAQYWSQPSMMRSTMNRCTKLLYKDFTMGTVVRPANPLNWLSDKTGLSVSFSSWEGDAAMVSFFCSPSKRAAHEHRDNNSFAIFKHAPLLVDAGYYDSYASAHYRNYYQRTIAHNSICVFDSTEQYRNFGSDASTDGGQVESAALMNYEDIFRPQNQRGRWIRYAAGDGYSYSAADAQLSYDTGKVHLFRRRLLHVKPDRVIVLDHVGLRGIRSRQRDISWIGHFADKPAISGTMTDNAVPGHIETFDGADYTATHRGGSIALRTLLPEGGTATRIGGAGYEYWVDGVNYPPLTVPDSSVYTPGAWRIEVRPPVITDTVVFLHTIALGDSLTPARAGGRVLRGSASIAVDWQDTLFVFPAGGDSAVSYHAVQAVSGGRRVSIFAADLEAGAYDIRVDGMGVSVAHADTNGILQTAVVLASGERLLEIVRAVSGLRDIVPADGIRLYPNPAGQELIVHGGGSNTVVEIYTILGVLKIRSGGHRIDISMLGPGVYLARCTDASGIRTARFIKR